MAPTVSDLYLAYRQAKAAMFFERRGVGLIELAKYEHDLPTNLQRLQERLSLGRGWFDHIPLGTARVTPKKRRTKSEGPENITRIGTPPLLDQEIEVQLRLSPSPEFIVTETLYLWKFGPLLESLLSTSVLGYRLDLRQGQILPTRRWLFEYWPRRYEEFRTQPLTAARNHLQTFPNDTVLLLSADLASYYDTISADYLLSDNFLRQLFPQGTLPIGDPIAEAYATATASLVAAYKKYLRQTEKLTGLPWPTGIPIGALTSRVVANLALASFDEKIRQHANLLHYARYVDDFVIVAKSSAQEDSTIESLLKQFVPIAPSGSDTLNFDCATLGRPNSRFSIQKQKARAHFLSGPLGIDFLDAIRGDFQRLVSERRAFLDPSVFAGNAASHLVRAGKTPGSPLRVLRDADRTRLERLALSSTLNSLERVSSLLEPAEAQKLIAETFTPIINALDSEENWTDNIETAFRLLRLATATSDQLSHFSLLERIGQLTADKNSSRVQLYYRGTAITEAAALKSIQTYIEERVLESICSSLPSSSDASSARLRPAKIRAGSRELGEDALRHRAELLAAADLRARDREEDIFSDNPRDHLAPEWMARMLSNELNARFTEIRKFTEACERLNDAPWKIAPAQLFLCTRPPSYFDIARRWLYQADELGFELNAFDELLGIVNAVRGTEYKDSVAQVVDQRTVLVPPPPSVLQADGGLRDPTIILGNLALHDDYAKAAAMRAPNSTTGRPLLTLHRLNSLRTVVDKATRVASRAHGAAMLVLPELSVPRRWFRLLANYVVKAGGYALVAGLEYLHVRAKPYVRNQVFAVLPGPFGSVAAWPWTKRLPAHHEAHELANLQPPVTFAPPGKALPRTVVHSAYGRFSVLICSELIESRRVADLVGRVELAIVPAWNRDTTSYEHLIQSAGLQMHAIVAIANNGEHSDCRVWAPRRQRWDQELCRLIERSCDDTVHVELPIRSLSQVHHVVGLASVRILDPKGWKPLPPEWP